MCVFVSDRETHKERKPGGIQIQKMKRKSVKDIIIKGIGKEPNKKGKISLIKRINPEKGVTASALRHCDVSRSTGRSRSN